MKEVIKKHWLAIILAIVIGLVMVGPQLIFIHSLGSAYRGLYMMGSDAEVHYLARMQEFKEGNGLGNPWLHEYRSLPSTFFTIAEGVLAFPGRLFHIPTPIINLLYKFLLPFLTALLVYWFMFRLVGDKYWSLATTAMVMLGNDLLSSNALLNILNNNPAFSLFAKYARPVNPEFSAIIFFSYLHLLLTGVLKKTWRWFVAVGLLFGFSFYIYFFSFTFLTALNGVMILLLLLIHRRDLAVKVLVATLIGITIGLPAIIQILQVTRDPLYQTAAALSGIMNTHAGRFSSVGILALIFFGWRFFQNKKTLGSYLLFALLLTGFVVINQQVLTGVLVSDGHYHWYFNIPIFILALFWAVCERFKNSNKKLVHGLLLVVSGLALYSALFIQYSSYRYWRDSYAEKQNYVEVLDWLNTNTAPEAVVLAGADLSQFIPSYTRARVYWSSYALFYLLPTETVEDRLFMYLKLNKYGGAVDDETMRQELVVMGKKNIDIMAFVQGGMITIYPPGLAGRYNNFLSHFVEVWDKYRLDYIVINARTNSYQIPTAIPLKLVFRSNNYQIFQTEAHH